MHCVSSSLNLPQNREPPSLFARRVRLIRLCSPAQRSYPLVVLILNVAISGFILIETAIAVAVLVRRHALPAIKAFAQVVAAHVPLAAHTQSSLPKALCA